VVSARGKLSAPPPPQVAPASWPAVAWTSRSTPHSVSIRKRSSLERSRKMASPSRESFSRLGLSWCGKGFGKRTCKPNSVVCGHSSRRRVAADAHQRPTRRFRHFLEPPGRVGQMRSGSLALARASLPIWSCSVWGLPCPRRYRRGGALLPHLFTLTPAGLAVQANLKDHSGGPRPEGRGVAKAVSFLWHWPSTSLEARVPDVIRHTALRSSDFPPPANFACANPPAATARSSCQGLVYRENGGSMIPFLVLL
jgi:hypothetical protein